jgi:single-strand DNA-binding protein
MRYLPDATPVTNFTAAADNIKKGGEKETIWLRVSAWNRNAEICNEYLKIGSKVFIEGKLRPDPDTGGPRVYQRSDGTSGSSYEVTAERVVFLDSKSDRITAEDVTEEPYF